MISYPLISDLLEIGSHCGDDTGFLLVRTRSESRQPKLMLENQPCGKSPRDIWESAGLVCMSVTKSNHWRGKTTWRWFLRHYTTFWICKTNLLVLKKSGTTSNRKNPKTSWAHSRPISTLMSGFEPHPPKPSVRIISWNHATTPRCWNATF